MTKKIMVSFFLFLSMESFGADSQNVVHSISVNDQLSALLKIEGVQPVYEACKKSSPDNVSTCLWNGLPKNVKKNVQEAYKKSVTVKSKVDLTKDQTNISSNFTNQQNAANKKLSDIIGKNLHDAMVGANEDKTKVTAIDHAGYNTLYKTEISKGIVDALNSYCMDVNFSANKSSQACIDVKKCDAMKDSKAQSACQSGCIVLTQDKDNNRAINIARLNQDDKDLSNDIGICIKNVATTCTYADNGDSKTNACLVVDFIKSSKKNLQANDEILKFYGTLTGASSLAITNLNQGQVLDEQKALTVTSKDVETAMKDANIALAKEASECAKDAKNPNCTKFLDTNKNAKEDAMAEFVLRKNAQEAELEAMDTTKDPTAMTDYLKAQGFTDDKIKEMTVDQNALNATKQMITEKFKAEKEALIKTMASRIKSTTSDKEGKIEASDTSKLSKIQEEINARTDNLKTMVRFNNLASSFLATKNANDKTGKTERNIASAQVELKADEKNQENATLKKSIPVDVAPQKTGKSVEIDINMINDILGF